MLRALLLGLLLACGGGESSTSPGVSSGVAAEAGKVREITGKVTAARGSQVRPLAVGNAITADDVIDTGTDGSVVIELVHNNALWSLESGIKARVDQSPAWTLAKQDAAKPIDHATSAAGRHADRQAADTQVTAIEKDPSPLPRAAPVTAPGKVTTREKGSTKDRQEKFAAPDRPDDAIKRGGDSPSPSDAAIAGTLPDAPDRRSITTAFQAIKANVASCFDKAASGTIKITARFGADGKVASAQIAQTPDHAMDSCVLTIVRAMTLSASKNGVTVSFPIQLRGP